MRILKYFLIFLGTFSVVHAQDAPAECKPGEKHVWVDALTGQVLAGGASMGQKNSRLECRSITSQDSPPSAPANNTSQSNNTQCMDFGSESGMNEYIGNLVRFGFQCEARTGTDPKFPYKACCSRDSNQTAAEPPCDQQTQQLKTQCQSEADTAKEKCDAKNGDWQADATRALQMASAGMQQVANSSIEMACSKMNDAMATVNAALGGFQTNCELSRTSCTSSCEQAKAAYETCIDALPKAQSYSVPQEITDNKRTCEGYKSRVADAVASVANIGSSFVMAKSCEEYAKSQEKMLDLANSNTCAQNPTAPGCEGPQNCSNPKFAATNTVCVCLSNPNDSRCGAGGGRLAGGGNLLPGAGKGGVILPGSGALGGSLGENMGGGSLFEPPAGQAGSLSGEDPGGKKAGAPIGGSGSAGLGGGPEGAGGRAGGRDANGNPVLKGFYGGSGGTGGSMYGASGSRTPGSDGNGYLRPGQKVPDLDKYRPEGLQQKLRPGMAGLVGPDGITSQHDNIFAKIKNRYNAKVMSLR